MAIPDIAVNDSITDIEATRAPRRFLRAVFGNRKAAIGAAILLVMAFVAAFPGLIAPDDPQAAVYAQNAGPSSAHLLGTTQLGQDVFSQLVWSTRLTLIVTLILTRFDARTTFLAGSVSSLNNQIVRLATYDTLTDLPNRRTLNERIERAIHASKVTRRGFAILFMDLDGFKTINDSLGHAFGDEVLKSFAQQLRQCVRNVDTVARLGGDEFVVLAENLGAPSDA